MSLFTFQRLQCLQLFILSKDYNVFSYISKTSMSSVIYAFKDYNIFIYIYKTSMSSVFYILQDFNVFCLLHFIRLRRLLSFIGLNVIAFGFLGFNLLRFYALEKKLQKSSALQNFNVLHFTFYKTSISSCFFSFTSLVFVSCPVE